MGMWEQVLLSSKVYIYVGDSQNFQNEIKTRNKKKKKTDERILQFVTSFSTLSKLLVNFSLLLFFFLCRFDLYIWRSFLYFTDPIVLLPFLYKVLYKKTFFISKIYKIYMKLSSCPICSLTFFILKLFMNIKWFLLNRVLHKLSKP